MGLDDFKTGSNKQSESSRDDNFAEPNDDPSNIGYWIGDY